MRTSFVKALFQLCFLIINKVYHLDIHLFLVDQEIRVLITQYIKYVVQGWEVGSLT